MLSLSDLESFIFCDVHSIHSYPSEVGTVVPVTKSELHRLSYSNRICLSAVHTDTNLTVYILYTICYKFNQRYRTALIISNFDNKQT